jgi:branched-chain amino acid transport system ATP-binding protein
VAEYAIEGRGLTKRFGGNVAVNAVDIRVAEGSFHAIIGPNGAGKTTLFNLLSGTLRPDDGGSVTLHGREITGLSPNRVTRLGLGRSYQTTSLFPKLTVAENVRLAVFPTTGRTRTERWIPTARLRHHEERVEAVLEQIGMQHFAGETVANLSHGSRRKVELGLLIAQDAQVLLLDEPTAGLAAEEIPDFLALVSSLVEGGRRTIVLVEHNMHVVMSLSDRISVLVRGALLVEGTPDEVRKDERVRDGYLGTGRTTGEGE